MRRTHFPTPSAAILVSLSTLLLLLRFPSTARPAQVRRVRLVPAALEVYPNQALLVSKGRVEGVRQGTVSFSLPGSHDVASLEVALEPSSCRLDGVSKAGEGPANETALEQQIEALKERREALENRHTGISQQVDLLQNIPKMRPRLEQGQLERFLEMVGRRIPRLLDKAREIARQIDRITQQIKELQARLDSDIRSRFLLQVRCASPQDILLRIRHPVQLKRRQFGYRVMGDTSQGSVAVKGVVTIEQASGETWRGIQVRYFTSPKNRAVAPPPFWPVYVGGEEQKEEFAMSMGLGMKAAPARAVRRPVHRRKAAFSRDIYEAGPITLPPGQEIPVSLFSYRLKGAFRVEVDGYATATPFLAVEAKAPVFLPAGPARYYLDGSLVGRGHWDPWPKGSKRSIYFGEDSRMEVTKKLEKFHRDHSFLGSKVTETTVWRYELKNHHPKAMEVVLTERVPLAADDRVEVKAWGQPQWDQKGKDGKVVWRFRLPPASSKGVLFGVSVKRPE